MEYIIISSDKNITTAQEYLEQATNINELIDSHLQELHEMKELSTTLSSMNYSKDKVQVSSDPDSNFSKIIVKITDLEYEINKEVDKLCDLKSEIKNIINNMIDNKEKLIFRYRYILHYRWEKIAEKMDLSPRTVHRIHASSLKDIKIIYENGTK